MTSCYTLQWWSFTVPSQLEKMAIKGHGPTHRNEVDASSRMRVRVNIDHMRTYNCAGRGQETEGGAGTATTTHHNLVSFPDPAFKLDKGLAHFARNLGLADSALPEIWRTNQIAYTY